MCFIETDDGVRLAYFSRIIPGAKAGVVVVHGLAEHKGRYEDFAARLSEAGISAFAVDLRGHGESSGARGDVGKFEDYLDDLGAFVRHIKSLYPGLKLAVFGHSLGGLIAAAYTARSGSLADLLILSSPSFETPGILRLLGWLPLPGFIKIKKRRSESKAMLAYNRSDPLACRFYTLRLLKAAFIHGVALAESLFGQVEIPVLMLGGRLDPLVDCGGLAAFLEEFGAHDKTLKIYENAKHRLVQNETADAAIADIIAWVKGRS